MNTNTFSIWPLMWQSLNVGVLLAIVIMGLRLAWLLWPRKKAPQEEAVSAGSTLAETIRVHRVERKMTQEFVAEALGVSRQAVSKWESGASEPSTSNLLALAKLFGVDAAELLPKGD